MRRVIIAALAGGGFLAWVLAVALEWPLVAWFAYGAWASLAVGVLLRTIRRPRDVARATVDAGDQVQDISLGRRAPTMYPPDPAASSQYGDAPAPGPLNLPER